MRRYFSILLFFLLLSPVQASVFSPSEQQILKANFYSNFMTNGAIVASPSTSAPDYYYDWVRDSALAMLLVESWYEQNQPSQEKALLMRYVDWVTATQMQQPPLPGYDILGEPKFYISGAPYDKPWGRPQNDGPALRAMVLIRFAGSLLDQGDTQYVVDRLYGNGLNPQTMGAVKMDLEYIAHHWQEPCFDLWEEVFGHHFFTRMVQRKALLEGATLARRLNEVDAAAFYEKQALRITQQLQQFVDPHHNIIRASLLPHSGPEKTLELDCAVILGVLLGDTQDGVFAIDDPRVINTVAALKKQFKQLYPINQQHQSALLIGRYPGDTYDGYETNSTGNPWYLLTATMAEYHYRMARHLNDKAHRLAGDAYLKLVKQYAPDLSLSEQINLKNGHPQGAKSLTWSYVTVFRAMMAEQ